MVRPPLRRAAAVALLAPVIACTHFTPYYRAGQARMVDPANPAAIDHRVILIGDTGAPRPTGEPVLELLAKRMSLMPERTTAVFLGDVVYERGMPEPISTVEKPLDAAADVMDAVLPDLLASRQEAERQMRAQLAVVAVTKARAVFVAGNHDWDQFEVGGWDRILALEQFIRDEAAAEGVDVTLTPSGGCPGPVAVPAGRRATVVAIDTQWWIETGSAVVWYRQCCSPSVQDMSNKRNRHLRRSLERTSSQPGRRIRSRSSTPPGTITISSSSRAGTVRASRLSAAWVRARPASAATGAPSLPTQTRSSLGSWRSTS